MLRLSQYGLEDQVSRRSIEMAGEKRYTLGTAGAAVVIKEFSDYT
jgi:hypothetical protein